MHTTGSYPAAAAPTLTSQARRNGDSTVSRSRGTGFARFGVFRDDASLSAAQSLWLPVAAALDESGWDYRDIRAQPRHQADRIRGER